MYLCIYCINLLEDGRMIIVICSCFNENQFCLAELFFFKKRKKLTNFGHELGGWGNRGRGREEEMATNRKREINTYIDR